MNGKWYHGVNISIKGGDKLKGENLIKNEPILKISNIWIGKNNYEHIIDIYKDIELLHMAMLIMRYYNKFNESRFNIKDIKLWFDVDISNARKKLKLLDLLLEEGYLKYQYPVNDLIVVTGLDEIFFPTSNFTILTETEIQTIIKNNTKENKKNYPPELKSGLTNANLLGVYFTIKSYMNMTSKESVAFPSEKRMTEHLRISFKSIGSCIAELKNMQLLSYINRGYNKAEKRNYGNVYALYDEKSEERLNQYIINKNKL